MANRNRVDSVISEGQGLIDEDHYSKDDIKKRMEELEMSWEALIAASAEKRERLNDAYQVKNYCQASLKLKEYSILSWRMIYKFSANLLNFSLCMFMLVSLDD